MLGFAGISKMGRARHMHQAERLDFLDLAGGRGRTRTCGHPGVSLMPMNLRCLMEVDRVRLRLVPYGLRGESGDVKFAGVGS